MRKDISVENLFGGDKINKSELARKYNCCWRTIDRRLNPKKYQKDKKERVYTSKLDNFKEIIDKKLECNNVPATGIYFLLKDKYGYKGKYGIVNKYVSGMKKSIINNLTVRFETIKGYQSQVDWKEKLKLHDVNGNEYIVSIFLIVLGYSRYKYIELTFNQTQESLFKCLRNAFEYFGGVTEEILFDNMKTIVDHTKSTYTEIILNSKATQFAKDAGFEIVTCRPYRPRTKGKVETLAKIMNRLKVYDYEFNTVKELSEIVKRLNHSLNYEEKSQATNEIPVKRFEDEKKYLTPVNTEILSNYYISNKTYKVSNESMVTYQGVKYSVPIQYVSKQITVIDDDNVIHLYYNSELINSYKKNNQYKYNYKEEDYIDLLKNSAFDNKTNEEIKYFINNNLKSMDGINIERNNYDK